MLTTDASIHAAIIKLTIAYTLLGAFVFTVIITCLGMVGWVKFTDKQQLNKLFNALIIELVTISVGVFANFLQFNPKQAQTEVRAPLAQILQVSEASAAANKVRAAAETPAPAEVQAAQVPATTPEQAQINDLVTKLFSDSGQERTTAYDQLTHVHRAKDYAADAILRRGESELSKPSDQRDFTGLYNTVVTLTDMSRAVTQKPEFKDRVNRYADQVAQASPRLSARTSTLKRWLQSNQ